MLVTGRDEPLEGRLLSRLDNFGDLFRQVQLVASKVLLQIVSAHYSDDPRHLIVIVRPLEKGINIEKKSGKGAPKRPNIKRIVILPVLDQEFRPFVVSAGYSHVVLLLRFVEVSESPVDDPEVAGLVVDDDVEGFNIAMHDSVGVGVVEGLEDLVDIQSDVHVVEAPHQLLGLNVRDILEHQTRRLGTFLADHVVHANDVRASV